MLAFKFEVRTKKVPL